MEGSTIPSEYFARCTVEKTLSEFHTDTESGLTTKEALHKLKTCGYNEFEVEDGESVIIKFLKQFVENPLILLLLGSAAVSLMMGNRNDAFSVLLVSFFFINVSYFKCFNHFFY